MAYLDDNGLLYLWNKIKALVANKVDKVSGKGLSTNDYTSAEKNKLAGVAENANNYVHSAASGSKHIPSGGSSGQYLKWSADGTAIWAADNNTTYAKVTATTDGLMAKEDKTKLDGVAAGANNYIHPATHRAGMIETDDAHKFVTAANIVSWDNKANNTLATNAQAGLMSPSEKMKINRFGEPESYALKADIVGMYKYKGAVADASKLPTTGQTTGDVYNIVAPSIYGAAGANVAWDGSKWDSLGEIFTITTITNAQIDTICA